jgi:hypothetical protein
MKGWGWGKVDMLVKRGMRGKRGMGRAEQGRCIVLTVIVYGVAKTYGFDVFALWRYFARCWTGHYGRRFPATLL